MNLKLLFTHGIRIIAVLAGLAVAGYGGQAALAKAGEAQRQVQRAAVVDTSRAQLSAQDLSGLTANLSVVAPAVVKSDVVTETQSTDDKDSLTAGQDDSVAELTDDSASSQVELSDDKSSETLESADMDDDSLDSSSSELEVTDDKSLDDASNATGDFEIRGAVSAINGNVVIVNGLSITIASTTEIKGTLKVGDMVKVEGIRLANNTVQAGEITIGSAQVEDQRSSISTGEGASLSGGGSLNSGQSANDDHGGSNSGSDDPSGHH